MITRIPDSMITIRSGADMTPIVCPFCHSTPCKRTRRCFGEANRETPAQISFRIANQFVEREARRYPGSRSKARAREEARILHDWYGKKAAVSPQTAHCPYTGEQRKVSELPQGWKWGKLPTEGES